MTTYQAAYLAIAIHFLRRIMRKAAGCRPPVCHGEDPQEPRYTIFVISDSGHRCLVADVYTELTDEEIYNIEERLRGVFTCMSVFAQYDPEFARGCSPRVDLFTLNSGRNRDRFTPAMARGACREILQVIPRDSFRML